MSEVPFHIEIQPGSPAYEQVIQAVHRALAKGLLSEGDAFPSVRALGKAAKINPNTAHKVVQALVTEGTLEVLPGLGTRVAPSRQRTHIQRVEMIRDNIDNLIIEACRLGFTCEDFTQAITNAWQELNPPHPHP